MELIRLGHFVIKTTCGSFGTFFIDLGITYPSVRDLTLGTGIILLLLACILQRTWIT